MEATYTKEKISEIQKISEEVFTNLQLEVGRIDDDFIYQELTLKLSGYVYSNMAEERDLVYYCDRPKSFDWLFRRKRKVVFHLSVKDLLINPNPKNTTRIYLIDQL